MANSLKSLWVVFLLLAIGLGILTLTLKSKQQADTVELKEVFKQVPDVAGVQNDPVSSPAIVTSPQDGQEAGFSVQVYSFQDKARADKALSALKQAGYSNAFMEVSDLGEKGIWYRIRIGSIKNEAQAKIILEEIRKNYNSGFIIKPKK